MVASRVPLLKQLLSLLVQNECWKEVEVVCGCVARCAALAGPPVAAMAGRWAMHAAENVSLDVRAEPELCMGCRVEVLFASRACMCSRQASLNVIPCRPSRCSPHLCRSTIWAPPRLSSGLRCAARVRTGTCISIILLQLLHRHSTRSLCFR